MGVVIKKIFLLLVITMMGSACWALDANTPYWVTLEKIEADGTQTYIEDNVFTANAQGLLEYEFSKAPTCDKDGVNFLLITISEEARYGDIKTPDGLIGNSVVLGQSLVPAPVSGKEAKLGINDLSAAQTKGILRSFRINGSDNPLLALIGYSVYTSPSMSAKEIQKIALGIEIELMDLDTGFFAKLSDLGVSAADIASFKKYMTCASTGSSAVASRLSLMNNYLTTEESFEDIQYDMAYFANEFYEANAQGEESGVDEALVKASTRLANILVNSLENVRSGNSDSTLNYDSIIYATQGMDFSTDIGYNSGSLKVIKSNIQTLFNRLNQEASIARLRGGLVTLGASTEDIAAFKTAKTSFDAAMETVAVARKDYTYTFDDTASGFNSGSFEVGMRNTYDQEEIAWQAFASALQSSTEDVKALVATMADIIDYPTKAAQLEQYYRDQGWVDGNGDPYYTAKADPYDDDWFFWIFKEGDWVYNPSNGQWESQRLSIPARVAYEWIASVIESGGSFDYTPVWADQYKNDQQEDDIYDTTFGFLQALSDMKWDIKYIEESFYDASFTSGSHFDSGYQSGYETEYKNLMTRIEAFKGRLSIKDKNGTALADSYKHAITKVFRRLSKGNDY